MYKKLLQEIQEIIRPLGIVFGDIGTSPLYTLTVAFLTVKPTEDNVLGVLSLIIWSLVILVYIQYAWLAMKLSIRGEGGTIILKEVLIALTKSKRQITLAIIISFIGISFIIGDGVITPAITILSAVEGLILVPGFEKTAQDILLFIAVIITIFLFSFQKRGTDKVSTLFSPVMLVWFLALGITGLFSIIHFPSVLKALNPYYAIKFFLIHKISGLIILSTVILAVTGGEALYADMGHLGKESIIKSWRFVFITLVLNYMGQGAFMILHPETKIVLFGMVSYESPFLYTLFLILSVLATIIASQAMISAMFSIVYQGINTNIMPRLKVDHTSRHLSTQIYISLVNWFLFLCVMLMLLIFQKSDKLAFAYGLAVNITMILTGIMLIWIYYLKKEKILTALSILVTVVDFLFFVANINKIHYGGFWSIIIAMLPLSIIIIYTIGQKELYSALKPMDLNVFLEKYKKLYPNINKISGTAIFLLKNIKSISPYIVETIFDHNILYEDNIILSIVTKDTPFGVESSFKERLAPGLRVFEIKAGYMEIIDIEKILLENGINEKVIFYGSEYILTNKILLQIYSIIKKLTPSIVEFYKFSPRKLQGVITEVKI